MDILWQMLAWNVGMECKVSGTEDEGFVPNFSFHISLSTLQHTEVKMLTKKFWSAFMMTASINSHVYTKADSFRVLVPCFC